MMHDLQPLTLDDLIREHNLPSNTKILGYAVHLPESDEFITKVRETSLGTERLYSRSPETAKKWPNVKRAIREAQAISHKYKYVSVALVLDIGEQIMILEVLTFGHENSES